MCIWLDAIVGLHWLPVFPAEFKVSELQSPLIDFGTTDAHAKVPFITTATRNGEKWESSMRPRSGNEPSFHHAADGRSALVYVSRDTKLTLMYQNEVVWNSTSIHLEKINASSKAVSGT